MEVALDGRTRDLMKNLPDDYLNWYATHAPTGEIGIGGQLSGSMGPYGGAVGVGFYMNLDASNASGVIGLYYSSPRAHGPGVDVSASYVFSYTSQGNFSGDSTSIGAGAGRLGGGAILNSNNEVVGAYANYGFTSKSGLTPVSVSATLNNTEVVTVRQIYNAWSN